LAENARERSRKPLIGRGEMNDRLGNFLANVRVEGKKSPLARPKLDVIRKFVFVESGALLKGRFSGKFLTKLPGKERKSGSEAGNRKLENPYSSRIFILGFPWLARVGALPKLDVAGSSPVARSTTSLNRISYFRRLTRRAASARRARGSHFQANFRLF
jgi:hypothetical protein